MAGLEGAEHFLFVNLDGDELDLFGVLLGYSDQSRAGLVEKQVMRRAGALHQRVGSPPQQFDARVLFAGASCGAQYQRVRAVMYAQPEGRVTHPRWGSFPAVLDSVGAQENPDNEHNAIYSTIKFIETGLRSASKSSAAGAAQAAAAQAAATQQLTAASLDPAVHALGVQYAAQGAGFAAAFSGADAGAVLPDVDASLFAMRQTQQALCAAANASPDMLRSAALALSCALTARNRHLAGAPPIIRYRLTSTESLHGLCQRLYGGRALEVRAAIERLTRIRRPYAMAAGFELLIPDPSVKVVDG